MGSYLLANHIKVLLNPINLLAISHLQAQNTISWTINCTNKYTCERNNNKQLQIKCLHKQRYHKIKNFIDRKKKLLEKRLKFRVNLESALAVVASKASFVIDTIISSELINKIHSFVTGHAFLSCSCKCHSFTNTKKSRKFEMKKLMGEKLKMR